MTSRLKTKILWTTTSKTLGTFSVSLPSFLWQQKKKTIRNSKFTQKAHPPHFTLLLIPFSIHMNNFIWTFTPPLLPSPYFCLFEQVSLMIFNYMHSKVNAHYAILHYITILRQSKRINESIQVYEPLQLGIASNSIQLLLRMINSISSMNECWKYFQYANWEEKKNWIGIWFHFAANEMNKTPPNSIYDIFR